MLERSELHMIDGENRVQTWSGVTKDDDPMVRVGVEGGAGQGVKLDNTKQRAEAEGEICTKYEHKVSPVPASGRREKSRSERGTLLK